MKVFLLATGLLFSVGVTHAITINFNDTAPTPNRPGFRITDFGPNGSYTEQGFTFQATNGARLATWDKDDTVSLREQIAPPVDGTDFAAITASQTIEDIPPSATLSGSSPFSLHSFNAASLTRFGTVEGEPFTLTGNLNGGGTVTETFTTLGNYQWDLFTLPSEWQNLDSVDFLATNFFLNLDNISVSQVPVPAAVWLFGSGLIGLIGMTKKHQK